MTGQAGGRRRRTNADGAWKRVLTDLLPDVLAFAVPDLHRAIDWSVQPVSLDKEFQAIARQAAVGSRVADLIVQLRLRSGDLTWLVLHVEVQGQPESDFAARMFSYYALLHLRLRRQRVRGESLPLILGLALLTDSNADWRPGSYEARAFGHGVRYDYWTVKLLDWRGRPDELAASNNPFAIVVQAWLGVLAAHGRADDLLALARTAFRQLRRGGYSDETSAAILAFLEQVLVAPNGSREVLSAALLDVEEETMAQVTSRWERSGMRKGRQEERQELLLLLLQHKFGALDDAVIERIQALSATRLLALYNAALDFTDRAELDQWLAAGKQPNS